ncbi:unnamed protein product [Notodromas monacha]|uniref:DNA methylase N-4/N-6 domain-containing protein n=1 Tax=Notodromas monacha TaxID=399045 RepID=A0A7R9GHY4_9CRUS|nr:unnamed protein product [Notodromas monacha]CAG0921840.1 unnamed protein product [Notodromas monacha]
MIFNCIDWERDDDLVRKLHPTQKPVKLLKKLIEIFTDEGDIVIDPCAGSGSTLVAALEMKRKAYGFEIKKDFHKQASEWVDVVRQRIADIDEYMNQELKLLAAIGIMPVLADFLEDLNEDKAFRTDMKIATQNLIGQIRKYPNEVGKLYGLDGVSDEW